MVSVVGDGYRRLGIEARVKCRIGDGNEKWGVGELENVLRSDLNLQG